MKLLRRHGNSHTFYEIDEAQHCSYTPQNVTADGECLPLPLRAAFLLKEGMDWQRFTPILFFTHGANSDLHSNT
jgi:hypothetical protein